MSPRAITRSAGFAVALLVAAAVHPSAARAGEPMANMPEMAPETAPTTAPVAAVGEPPAHEDEDRAQLPYEVPRQTLIPGTPGMPGGFHLMVNGFAQAQNTGLGAHRIANDGVKSWNGGATYPIVSDDWLMAYGRDAKGYVEGLLMLNLEPFTVGPAGIPEIGQSGEGLWDAQHSHQLIHQAMFAPFIRSPESTDFTRGA